jgi:hypothetical protein
MSEEGTSGVVLTAAAQRMRRHRNRRRIGLRAVRIVLNLMEIQVLIERGYLDEGSRDDVDALQFATKRIISNALSNKPA